MKSALLLTLIFALSCALPSISKEDKRFVPATGTFDIPETEPDIVITSSSLTLKDDQVFLEGNVRAIKDDDTLLCERAIVNNSPRWILATIGPELRRRETLPAEQSTRITVIKARNIFYNAEDGIFNASDSVDVKIDEASWDRSRQQQVIVTADEMTGFRDNNQLIFRGNVKIRDGDNYGEGQRLDYLQDTNIAILTGNAFAKTYELNKQTNELEERTLKGEKITYNTETRMATSE